MSLAEHLHPKTYWEKRCELLEESVDRLVRILSQTQPPQVQRELGDHFSDWSRLLESIAIEHPAGPTGEKA